MANRLFIYTTEGLSHCCSNLVIPTLSDIANDPHDYQQKVIIREIQKRLKLIQVPLLLGLCLILPLTLERTFNQ
jgi:hypothetical protein